MAALRAPLLFTTLSILALSLAACQGGRASNGSPAASPTARPAPTANAGASSGNAGGETPPASGAAGQKPQPGPGVGVSSTPFTAPAPASASGVTATAAPAGAVAPPPTAAASPAPIALAGATAAASAVPASAATAAATAAAAAAATSAPTATPSATAEATVVPPPQARRLTEGGCCAQPFFLDGRVTFLDRPAAGQPGFYAVPAEGGAPALVEARVGYFHLGGAFFSYLDGDTTVVERRSDRVQWRLNTSRQPVTLSPDGTQVSWTVREWEGAFDRRRSQVYWAPLEGGTQGGSPRLVASLYGGGLSAWLPASAAAADRWLMTGRRALEENDRALFVFDLGTGQVVELLRGLNIRGASLSPDGRWLLTLLAAEPQPERNGLWLVRTDGGEKRKLDWFGAYAWRDPGHVLYFPYKLEAGSHQAWQYDVNANSSQPLTDPARTPFKIAQGDFALSPDGLSLAFVSAADNNIWLLSLPTP